MTADRTPLQIVTSTLGRQARGYLDEPQMPDGMAPASLTFADALRCRFLEWAADWDLDAPGAQVWLDEVGRVMEEAAGIIERLAGRG